LLLACKTPPQTPVETAAEEAVIEAAIIEEPDAEIDVIDVIIEEEQIEQESQPDVHDISQELHDKTLAEVKLFIDNLNITIKNKNFNGWRAALSDEYFAKISSPEFLKQQNESQALKLRNIVLRTPNDYFLNVVVPSRANSQVDDIESIDANNVKAYYLETRTRRNENNDTYIETRRLRLYDLTKAGNEWKIKS